MPILLSCSIIDISYRLILAVVISGWSRNMEGRFPIAVGTIPIRNEDLGSGQEIQTLPAPVVPQISQEYPSKAAFIHELTVTKCLIKKSCKKICLAGNVVQYEQVEVGQPYMIQ